MYPRLDELTDAIQASSSVVSYQPSKGRILSIAPAPDSLVRSRWSIPNQPDRPNPGRTLNCSLARQWQCHVPRAPSDYKQQDARGGLAEPSDRADLECTGKWRQCAKVMLILPGLTGR